MSYVVLARKWRPQSFDDLVGQEHVALTLANSIAQERVAHAFLFTGVRGVGKTTSARILAKALNCEKGPTAKPCLVCSACTEIAAGVDLDVLEIDGATYTGVNDIRQLQESLPYRPNRDRFKIYIVDEVHMLSNSAWNAFLKTLEEPPPHVKFIFATTEVHKVPITILSRCQRYDFKLIGAQAIAARLRHVLDAEKIDADDGALSILAREAAGSMRDAMSLLDQVIAWAGPGQKLTSDAISRVLGVADRSMLGRLATALVDGDAPACLAVVGELAEQGYDVVHVTRDFLAHLRDVVVAKVAPDARTLVDVADAELAEIKELSARAQVDDLTRLHQGLSKSFDDIARSLVPRAALEMTLVRLARRPPLVPIDDLVRKLTDLEHRLSGATHGHGSGGAAGGAQGGGPGAPGRGGPPRNDARQASSLGVRTSAGDDRAAEPPAGPAPAPPRSPPPPSAPPRSSPPFDEPPATQPSRAAPAPDHPNRFVPPPFAGKMRADDAHASSSTGSFAPDAPGATSPPASRPPPSGAPPSAFAGRPPPPPLAPDELARLRTLGAIVERIREKRQRLAPVFERAHVLSIDAVKLALGFEARSFEAGQLASDPSAREVCVESAREILGPDVEVELTEIPAGTGGVTLSRLYGEIRRAKRAAVDESIRKHPLVTAALDLLGAELRDVRLPPEIDTAPVSVNDLPR